MLENEMAPKLKLVFVGSVLLVAILACQSGIIPVSVNPIPKPTKPIETPTGQPLPSTPFSGEAGADASGLPFHFLADPNTACAINLFDGLSCLDQDGWHAYGSDSFKAPLRNPWRIALCPDGRIYLYDGLKLYMRKDETLLEIEAEEVPGEMQILACGAGNDLWVSYLEGVSHLKDSSWTHYPATQYFGVSESGGLVNSLAVAPNGRVWVTTYTAIAFFDGTTWQVVKTGGNYESLVVDTKGKIWVIDNTNTYHLLAYDGVQWSTVPTPEATMRLIALDRENRVWAGTVHNQLYTLDPQTNSWTLQAEALQFGSGSSYSLKAMQFDRQNRLWASSNYGLGVYDGSTWTVYRMDNADLFANDNDEIVILGNGPPLPAPLPKAPGSVQGRLVKPSAANLRAEICLFTPQYSFAGDSPCADQAYHALTTIDADGNFLFKDVPAGKYHLIVEQSPGAWFSVVDTPSIPFVPDVGAEFEVKPGTETQLGDITPSTP
jgi:streptogramin lyase